MALNLVAKKEGSHLSLLERLRRREEESAKKVSLTKTKRSHTQTKATAPPPKILKRRHLSKSDPASLSLSNQQQIVHNNYINIHNNSTTLPNTIEATQAANVAKNPPRATAPADAHYKLQIPQNVPSDQYVLPKWGVEMTQHESADQFALVNYSNHPARRSATLDPSSLTPPKRQRPNPSLMEDWDLDRKPAAKPPPRKHQPTSFPVLQVELNQSVEKQLHSRKQPRATRDDDSMSSSLSDSMADPDDCNSHQDASVENPPRRASTSYFNDSANRLSRAVSNDPSFPSSEPPKRSANDITTKTKATKSKRTHWRRKQHQQQLQRQKVELLLRATVCRTCVLCEQQRRVPRTWPTKPGSAWYCEQYLNLPCLVPNDSWNDVAYHFCRSSYDDTTTAHIQVTDYNDSSQAPSFCNRPLSLGGKNSQSIPSHIYSKKADSNMPARKRALAGKKTKSRRSSASAASKKKTPDPPPVSDEKAVNTSLQSAISRQERRSRRGGGADAEILSLPYKYGDMDWDPLARAWIKSSSGHSKKKATPLDDPAPDTPVMPDLPTSSEGNGIAAHQEQQEEPAPENNPEAQQKELPETQTAPREEEHVTQTSPQNEEHNNQEGPPVAEDIANVSQDAAQD